MNALCERLGIQLPILQAPIGSVASPELCAAVSNAGGLGALGVTWTSEERLRERIRRVRELTDKPFQVNYVLHFKPKTIAAALEEGAPIVTFSWGDPSPYLPQVQRRRAKVGVQVGSANAAAYWLSQNADFLILQGVEAGGHVQGHDPLDRLLSAAEGMHDLIPTAAAGGITEGTDIRRVLEMGAGGAVLGTRFVATEEADAHPLYKEALMFAEGNETVLTTCFDGGWPSAPHRVLRNATFAAWEMKGCGPTGRRIGEGDLLGRSPDGEAVLRYDDAAPRRGTTGEIGEMCLYAGTGVGKIRDCPPAAELVGRLARDAGLI